MSGQTRYKSGQPLIAPAAFTGAGTRYEIIDGGDRDCKVRITLEQWLWPGVSSNQLCRLAAEIVAMAAELDNYNARRAYIRRHQRCRKGQEHGTHKS